MKKRIVLILVIVAVLGAAVFGVWWWVRRNTGERLLARARLALQAKNFERALDLAKRYTDGSPDDWRGPYFQAQAHIYLGRYDEARNALTEAARIAPDEVRIPMARADTFAHPARRSLASRQAAVPEDVLRGAIKQLAQARDVLAGISIPDENATLDAAEALGLVETELGSARRALSWRLSKDAEIADTAGATDQAKAKRKESADAGKAANDHFQEAARLLLTVVQQDARLAAEGKAQPHERAANTLVRLCMDRADRTTLDAAREAIRSLESPPPLAAAMLVSADVISAHTEARSPAEREKLLDASKGLDDILDRHPDHPDAVRIKVMRAELALRLDDYETVKAICNGILETDARNTGARLMLATALMNSGGAAQAERDLFALKTQLPPQSPYAARAHLAYAQAALRSGKLELAKEALRKATEFAPAQSPEHASARLTLAKILLSGGFHKEAFTEAEAIFHARQDLSEAVAKYAQAAGRTGNGEAIDDVRNALKAAEAVLELPETPPDDINRFCDTLQAFAKAADPIWPAGGANREIGDVAEKIERALGAIASGQADQARNELDSAAVKSLRGYAEKIFAAPVAKWLAVGEGYAEFGAWAAREGDQEMTKEAAAAARESWQQAVRLKPTTLAERLPAAQALLRLGRADDAEKALKEIIKDHPESAEAHDRLGLLYAQVGRVSQAIEQYKVAVELVPRNAGYRLRLAGLLFDVGLLDQASDELKRILEMDPSYEPAKRLAMRIAILRGESVEEAMGGRQEGLALAVTYLSHGKPDECIRICQAALKENEDDRDARWWLGRAYWVLGQPHKCIEQWKRLVTASPGRSAIYRDLARVLSRDQTPQEIDKTLAAIPGARPEMVDLAIGWLFRQRRQYEAAAEAYGRAAGRAEALPDTRNYARLDRAGCLALAGHPDRAIVELGQMPDQEPWRHQVLIRKAAILAGAGRADEAVPILLVLQNSAVQAKNTPYLTRVGRVYLQIGRAEKALEVADEIERLTPNEPQSCLLRADALNAMGRRSEAVECYRKAVARRPTSIRLRMYLAAALDVEGRLDEALKTLAELQKHGEAAEIQALYRQGLLLARWGLYEEAVQYLNQLARKGEVVGPGLRAALGEAFARLAKTDRAREELQKISKYAPQYVGAQQLLAGLATTDDEKLAILRRIEADRPGRATVVSQRMTILKRANRLDDALKEFQSFRHNLPEGVAPPDFVTLFAVHIMLEKGDHQGASALCLQAEKETRSPLWKRLGILLMMEGQPDKAADLLPDPSNEDQMQRAPAMDVVLGLCLAAQTGESATTWADRLAAIEQRLAHAEPPRSMPRAYKVLATVATRGTMKDEQLAAFTGRDLVGLATMRELVSSAESHPGIRAEAAKLLKATIARDLGLVKAARAWALDVLKARPTSQWAAALAVGGVTDPDALREVLAVVKPSDCLIARVVRASVLESEGKHAEAAEIYRTAAEAEKGNPQFLMYQAMATERAGRRDQALALYRQVWEKTKNPTAANNAAYLLSGLYPQDAAKLAEAAKWADTAVEAAPSQAAYRDTKGWVAYLQGRNDEACTELRRAVKGLPNSPEVHYHLGMAEARAGNTSLARWHLGAAVSLGEILRSQDREVSEATREAIRLADEALAKIGGARG